MQCLRLPFTLAPLVLVSAALFAVETANPTMEFVGEEKADTSADGGLRPVVGTHNIQVLRANKTHSPHADDLLHSYLHAPMLAWWKGKFYLQYLSGPRHEHEAPCITSFMSSPDGLHWSKPRTAFPPFTFPDGSVSISHQRMGFYVSPKGRLLMLSFYGKAPAPNDGTGMGRAVREIFEDGTLSPVYFIRLNTHAGWTPEMAPYPMYTRAEDRGFIEACEALLANKLMTAQWWEEDQAKDGFFTATGRALSFVHRPDGSVLGIWKNAVTTTTSDEGLTWSNQIFAKNLPVNASKYWLQRSSDSRYVLVYNPTFRLRHPLALSVSDDSRTFRELLAVHGELPDQRFGGGFKNLGPQYVRGIAEGNGTGPDSALWLTYSVNKEDIWISRVPVPIRSRVEEPVKDDFENEKLGSLPATWNIYSPLWAPVRVSEGPSPKGRVLRLMDEDPYDYARAVRVFPETHGLKLSFKVFACQLDARLEIDLQSARGARPVRIVLKEDGHVWACHEGQWMDAGAYAAGRWHSFELEIAKPVNSDRCEFRLDGSSPLKRPLVFTDPAGSLERISFRTGPYRHRGEGGRDLPGADKPGKAACFMIDDLAISPQR